MLDNTSILKALKQVYLLISIILISACASNTSEDSWPTNMPERQIFVSSYEKQIPQSENDNNLNDHLVWIKRFYQGSIIYPLGWLRMTDMLIDTIEDPSVAADVSKRMEVLGLEICLEWAKDNAIRKIDSAAVATWGNSLKTAADQGEQVEFVTKVEADVAALLDGSLNLKMINRERYYPPEDYDNF